MDKQKIPTATPARPVLGKGLASLLPAAGHTPPLSADPSAPPPVVAEDSNRDRHPGISMCSVDEIVANEYQPRHVFDAKALEDLAASIQANGLIQPLVVRKASRGYQLIAGERRLRAAKLAGLKHVPIVIRRSTDKEALELALIENIQREDLSCIETAKAYERLMVEFQLKQDDVAVRVGKDRTSVANHLRLLRLPEKIQEALNARAILFGHAKVLMGLENSEEISSLAEQCIEKQWSVRELEVRITQLQNLRSGRKLANDAVEEGSSDPIKTRFRTISRELTAHLSSKVGLRGTEDRGRIVIEYFSKADLDRVLDRLYQESVK